MTIEHRSLRPAGLAIAAALIVAAGSWWSASGQARATPESLPDAARQRQLMLNELQRANDQLGTVMQLLREIAAAQKAAGD